MTENKRFIIDVEELAHENAIFEYDTNSDDYDFVCYEDDFDNILKRMNELSEENEQLKQYNQKLTDENDELRKDNDYFERKKEEFLGKWSVAHSKNIQLRQENEQLKSKLFDCNLELEHSKESVDDAYWELTEIKKENEQLKKDRFICLDCEHSGYTEIGCLCEYDDHWVGFMSECEDFKELRE